MDIENIPRHVALIVDGNRRWAKERGLKSWEGYLGISLDNIEEISRVGADLGIPFVTFWGGSYKNLTERPSIEIKKLNEMYALLAQRALDEPDLDKNEVRVRFMGEWKDLLQKKPIEKIEELIEKTKNYSKNNLTYMIGYNGDREMLSAINKIIEGTPGKPIDEDLLVENLWTKDLPPVDLVIRTGNDPHLSTGFMMWHTKNALLHFDDKMWPDFTKEEFIRVINDFTQRERRFGK
ncbi:MAG: di-trans,poly-cis-decaprenylcistransferase [Candidatus Colwellbacteria bacterium CG10_big_fil_rev_8_21_14_0_10_41_28]|uniref:Di-trans,poly-cis-decaprenylcistransferase n=1 Tax=Candidatus Colwellbacteria bacterium CG10_big_fil_rev_8_21_14_0_10_41_28 TaxID=1974539 RepID=A0A2H0VHQ1_9BACT|nr:MAG: di-trans,poly-cis-decaprenylcistransferase [Candidatus Colwellbacteria bacterium CG10_big_fil_rev_8_21_14_0_10_41_28]